MKYIKTFLGLLVLTAVLIPVLSSAVTAVGWSTPTSSTGWVLPNKINGTNQIIDAINGLFSTASSTFSSSLFLTSLGQGIVYTGTNSKVNAVATTTLTASSPLALSNPVVKVGGSNSVLTLDTTGTWSGNAVTATALAANGTNCAAGNYPLGVDASGNVESCTTASGAGTVTSITAGAGHQNQGAVFTSSGTLVGAIATSAIPTISPAGLAYWTLAGDTVNPAKLGSVATTTLSGSGVISVTAGATTLGSSPITVSCATCGTGSVTSITLGAGHQNQGLVISSSGTVVGAIATSATPVINPAGVAYWTGVGDASNPAKIGTTATSSIADGTGITTTNGSTAYVIGSQPTINCNTATAAVFGCLTSANFSKFNSATTTFSTGLTYTLGTNAVTVNTSQNIATLSNLTTNGFITTSGAAGTLGVQTFPISTAQGGTNNASLSADQILYVDHAGTKVLTTATSTLNVGTATALAANGTNCSAGNYPLGVDASGNVENCTVAGAGGSSQWATSTAPVDAIYNSAGNGGGYVGIGTTTPRWVLNVASTTKPQIALTGNTTDNEWVIRGIGNTFAIATASPTTFATSTTNAFTINANGFHGVGTSSPMSPLSVMGNEDHWGNYYHFGPATGNDTSFCLTTSQCFSYFGNDNTSAGSVIEVGNIFPGANAYTGFAMCNDLCDNSLTHYFGMYINAHVYSYPGFGTALAFPDQMQLSNTDGRITLAAQKANSTASLINFLTGGTTDGVGTAGNERMRIDNVGRIGMGTSTPIIGLLNIATTTESQIVLSAGAGLAGWAERSVGGNLYFSTTTIAGTATTSTAAFSLIGSGKPSLGISSSTPNATLTVESRAGDFNYQMYVGSTTAPSFYIDNSKHIFIPNITQATAGTNQTVCFKSATGELIDETTTACAVSSIEFKNLLGNLNISGLKTVMALKPVVYSYKEDVPYDFQNTQYGFIAEEVAKVDPHLAEYGTNGLPRTLDDRAIMASVVKAIQELATMKGAVRSVEENWQNAFIALLIIGFVYQQMQIKKLRNER